MNKKLIGLGLSLMMVFGLVGCNNSDGLKEEDKQETNQEEEYNSSTDQPKIEEDKEEVEEPKEDTKTQEEKLEEAREYVESRASEVFENGEYKVIVENNIVVLMTYVKFSSNDSIESWNKLVETIKDVSVKMKLSIDEDVRFAIMVGSSDDSVNLVVENGVVYYDTFNHINLFGAETENTSSSL